MRKNIDIKNLYKAIEKYEVLSGQNFIKRINGHNIELYINRNRQNLSNLESNYEVSIIINDNNVTEYAFTPHLQHFNEVVNNEIEKIHNIKKESSLRLLNKVCNISK